MTALTPEVEREILAQYARTRSPYRAARAVGVSPTVAWEVIDRKNKQDPFETRFDGRGRPEMERFTVATRRASERGWDNADPAIVEARARYEAGTHTMATGRDGPWLILYSIPLRWPNPAQRGYFSPENF